jgi:hypothetical protein
MVRIATALASAAAIAAGALIAFVAIPTSPAGSATSCVAWASLPAKVSLAGREVYVRATLHGSPECAGATTDNGGTGTLNGPGRSTSDFPLRWERIGDSDTAPFYASINALGTYRISNGDLQTYDTQYRHIPFEWHTTSTVVKLAGRFRGVTVGGGAVSARLQYYAKYGWEPHAGVLVVLQRAVGDSHEWHTVGQARTSGAGRVGFGIGSGHYRLVSATTGSVWSTTTWLPSSSASSSV